MQQSAAVPIVLYNIIIQYARHRRRRAVPGTYVPRDVRTRARADCPHVFRRFRGRFFILTFFRAVFIQKA